MSRIRVAVERLAHNRDLPLPAYETAQAAGMDLPAAVRGRVVLDPGKRALIPTGLAIAVPDGYEAQVRPRSGLAAREGVTLLNAPGTIDADYRGEVKILLVNLGERPFAVERGMRVAQMVIAPVGRAVLVAAEALPGVQGALGFSGEDFETRPVLFEAGTLPKTARGGGGFGSTGAGPRAGG